MDIKNTLRQKKYVDILDCGINRKLAVNKLLELFTNIGSAHVEQFELGIEDLNKSNKFWVIAEIEVVLNSNIKSNSNISLITYPIESQRLFFERNFEVFVEDKNNLACAEDKKILKTEKDFLSKSQVELSKNSKAMPDIYAITNWCILDKETHKIVAIKNIKYKPPKTYKSQPYIKTPFNFIDTQLLEKVGNSKVEISDLDFNYHMNNTKYILKCLNTMSMQDYEQLNLKHIQMRFLKECALGTELNIYSYKYNGVVYYEIRNENSIPVFRLILNA